MEVKPEKESKTEGEGTTWPKVHVKPCKDVASIKNGGCMLNTGVELNRNEMLRENWTEYNGSKGFSYTSQLGQPMIVAFKATYMINTIKLLLWDQDARVTCYKIEVSTDQNTWTCVADNSSTPSKSWQEHIFTARPVKYIRVYNTTGSTHPHMCIVKLMAYLQ